MLHGCWGLARRARGEVAVDLIEDTVFELSPAGCVVVFLHQKMRTLISGREPAWAETWECIGGAVADMTGVEGRYSGGWGDGQEPDPKMPHVS